jgi:hypothetical protein
VFLDDREVFLLCRAAEPAARSDPAALVRDGFLVDGWRAALDAAWPEDALRCLLLLTLAKMELLFREALPEVRADLGQPRLAFLLKDFDLLPTQRLAGLKQGLLDRLRPGKR